MNERGACTATRRRRGRAFSPVALAVVCALRTLVTTDAAGQGRQTWGEAPPAPTASVVAIPSSSGAPPAPPPASLGVPVEGAETAPPPSGAAGLSGPIVHAPGVVGLRYTLEGIEVRGNTTTLARVVLRYVPFHAGDPLDPSDRELELTRFRLLGTGFFRDVQLSLRKGSRRGYVVLVVDVAERNTIVVDNVWLGLSADANPDGTARPLTAYGGAAVSETNLGGTGITLGGAFAFAQDQFALRARVVDPQFLNSEWSVEAELLYNNAEDYFGNRDVLVDYGTSQVAQDYAILKYHRFGGSVGAGHDLGISTQLFLDYRLEQLNATVPPAASDHRGLDIEPIDFYIDPGTTVLSTIRATLVHDTRDEPVLPTKGDRLVLIGDASLSPLGSDYPYAKVQARATHWLKLPWDHVLRLEAFAGAIFGSAPVFEKFYIGDFSDFLPDRVLDLNVDRRPAPNFFGTDIVEIRYGDYAAELQAEYRIPVYRGHRSIYGIDFFTSAGVYGVANGIDFTNHARGYSGFATVPIDLTFNFGLRVDTSVGGVVFGLSNFLGFIPVRGTTEGAAR
jgi:outer membrane protein insertion porin family